MLPLRAPYLYPHNHLRTLTDAIVIHFVGQTNALLFTFQLCNFHFTRPTPSGVSRPPWEATRPLSGAPGPQIFPLQSPDACARCCNTHFCGQLDPLPFVLLIPALLLCLGPRWAPKFRVFTLGSLCYLLFLFHAAMPSMAMLPCVLQWPSSPCRCLRGESYFDLSPGRAVPAGTPVAAPSAYSPMQCLYSTPQRSAPAAAPGRGLPQREGV